MSREINDFVSREEWNAAHPAIGVAVGPEGDSDERGGGVPAASHPPSSDPRHPHEIEEGTPPIYDEEGRCLRCGCEYYEQQAAKWEDRFHALGQFVTTQLSERGLLSDPAIEVALPVALSLAGREVESRRIGGGVHWCWPHFDKTNPADKKRRAGLNRYPHNIIGAYVVLFGHGWGVRWKDSA